MRSTCQPNWSINVWLKENSVCCVQEHFLRTSKKLLLKTDHLRDLEWLRALVRMFYSATLLTQKMLRSLDLLEVIKRIKRSAGDYSDQDSRTGGGTSAAH